MHDRFLIPIVKDLLDELKGALFFPKLDMRSSYRQALMNEVLHPFFHRFVLVFFNDILINSQSWTEHLQHVRVLFAVLCKHEWVLKQFKRVFSEHRMLYLGHDISKSIVAMDDDKIAVEVLIWSQVTVDAFNDL